MDFLTLLSAIGWSVVASSGVAGVMVWLSKTAIQHRLNAALETRKSELARELEDHKGALAAELAREKAEIEGQVRAAVERELGDAAAQRQYEFEARKRLYTAIGPLRFQLIMACRDFAARIANWTTVAPSSQPDAEPCPPDGPSSPRCIPAGRRSWPQ